MTAAQEPGIAPEAKKPRITEDQLAAAVVVGVHRLVKQSTLYTTENEAQRRQLELTQRAVLAYGRRTGRNPKIYFADKSVFICGRMLRAGRVIYDAALELGTILKRFGVDEMTIGFDVPVEELKLFQKATADAIRGGQSPAHQHYTRVRLKRGLPPGRRPDDDDLSPQEILVRGYCTSIVVMRRFFESVQTGKLMLPVRVRRVAQQLADLGAIEEPAFLGTTALYNARHEHAGRAVNSAMVAIGMARQITDDGRLLARIAMAALLYDVGLARVAGAGPTGEGRVGMALPKLVEHQFADWPPATAAMTTALGGLGDASITHTVLCYEAIWHNCRATLGAPYGGLRPVTMEARIVAVARRFNELLADPDEELDADQAVSRLLREASDDADGTAVRLLMCALGLFPTGTLVELSTRQIAQVVRTSDNPRFFSHPVVRPVIDASGGSVGQANEIDLATDQSGIHVVRLVATGDDREVRAAQHRSGQHHAHGNLSALPAPPRDPPALAPLPPRAPQVSYGPSTMGPNTLDNEFDGVFGNSLHDHDAMAVELEPDDGDELEPLGVLASSPPEEAGYGEDHGQPEPNDYGDYPDPNDYGAAYGQPDPADHGQPDYGQPDYGQPDYGQPNYGESGANEHPAESQGYASYGSPKDFGGAPPAATPGHGYAAYGQPFDQAASYDQPFDRAAAYDQAPSFEQTSADSLEPPPPPSDEYAFDDDMIADEPTAPIPDARELAATLDRSGGRPEPPPPRSSNAGGMGSADVDDEDDVPSMVLQAIVDGRSQQQDSHGDEGGRTSVFRGTPNQLHKLFFDRDQRMGRATKPRPDRPADSGRMGDAPPEGSPLPRSGAARRPAISQTTPTGIHQVTTAALEHARARALEEQAKNPLAMPPQRSADRAPMAMPAQRRAGRGQAEAREVPAGDAPRRSQRTMEWLQRVLTAHRPTSQGNLTKTPLLHLLVYTLDRGLSGTLMLVTEDAMTHFVYFDGGVPSKVRTTGDVAPLDRVLVEMAILDERTVADSLAEVRQTGELHGRVLVKKGLIDVGTITGALQWQLIRKISYMLKLPPQTRFAYYDGVNMLDEYGGPQLTPADPLAMIMTGVRVLGSSPLVKQTLARLGSLPLRVRREADIRRLHLKEPEQRVVDLLRSRPMTLAELLSKQVAVPLAVELTIYALIITRCLNLSANQKPPVGYGVAAVELRWDPAASPGRPSHSGQPSPPARPSRPGPTSPQSSTRPNMRRGTSTRGTIPRRQGETGRGAIPRRGTSSTAAPQPLPRRGTSSARGEPLPRRGTSSAHGQPLPRHGQPDTARPAAPPRTPEPAPPRQARPPAAPARPSQPEARPSRVSQTAPRAADASLPPRGAASSRAPAAAGEPPPGSLQRAEIEARASSLDDQTYFQILGIEEGASANDVQSAYFKLAKSWHPDRLHASLADVKPKVAMVFARINEAYQTLSNADKRSEYEETVKQGGGTARDRELVERVIDSALLFQKGEVMFRKGSYKQSEEMVKRAVDADPDQPEYRALLAWIQAHCLGQPPEGADDRRHFYRDQIKMLDVVIKQEADYERALFYRGQLLKRSGFEEAALKDFRKVVQLNPRNIDAAREVRLSQMRSKKEEKTGIFGRFFNKDK